jgi:hypothetical protein
MQRRSMQRRSMQRRSMQRRSMQRWSRQIAGRKAARDGAGREAVGSEATGRREETLQAERQAAGKGAAVKKAGSRQQTTGKERKKNYVTLIPEHRPPNRKQVPNRKLKESPPRLPSVVSGPRLQRKLLKTPIKIRSCCSWQQRHSVKDQVPIL